MQTNTDKTMERKGDDANVQKYSCNLLKRPRFLTR